MSKRRRIDKARSGDTGATDRTDRVIYPIISNVASANEGTGMIPVPPMTDDEGGDVRRLFSVQLPEEKPDSGEERTK